MGAYVTGVYKQIVSTEEENTRSTRIKPTFAKELNHMYHGGRKWTQDMCSKSGVVQDRGQPGAEIFKVDMEKGEEEVEEEIEEFEQDDEVDLHCHKSCKMVKWE